MPLLSGFSGTTVPRRVARHCQIGELRDATPSFGTARSVKEDATPAFGTTRSVYEDATVSLGIARSTSGEATPSFGTARSTNDGIHRSFDAHLAGICVRQASHADPAGIVRK